MQPDYTPEEVDGFLNDSVRLAHFYNAIRFIAPHAAPDTYEEFVAGIDQFINDVEGMKNVQ